MFNSGNGSPSSGVKTWQRIFLASHLIHPKWASRQRDSRWKQKPLKSHVRLSFPTWKERHSRNYWHGLNHQTWDLSSDTVCWQRTDSSHLLSTLPLLDEGWVREYAMNLIVHCLTFMEIYMSCCRCLSFYILFIFLIWILANIQDILWGTAFKTHDGFNVGADRGVTGGKM